MPTLDNYSLSNFGLGGTTEKYASGVVTYTGTVSNSFISWHTGSLTGSGFVTVSPAGGFGFVPKSITIRSVVTSGTEGLMIHCIFISNLKNSRGYSYANAGFGTPQYGFEVTIGAVTSGLYVDAGTFKLPVPSGASAPYNLNWEAYG